MGNEQEKLREKNEKWEKQTEMQLYVFVLIAGVGGETENIWKGKELRCSQNSFFPVDGEWVG